MDSTEKTIANLSYYATNISHPLLVPRTSLPHPFPVSPPFPPVKRVETWKLNLLIKKATDEEYSGGGRMLNNLEAGKEFLRMKTQTGK